MQGRGSSRTRFLTPACEFQCSQNKRLKREREFVLPTQKTLLGSSPP